MGTMMGTMVNPTNMGMSMPGMVNPNVGTPMQHMPVNMAMMPRCTMKLEKCTGGMKITCVCEDKMSATTLQNLCNSMVGSLCSCCCLMNGMTVCCCNLTMGMCKCEVTADGVCITCTSGDKDCCTMIQSCCDSLTAMMKAGCTCCVMLNGMPVCCC